MEDRLRDAHIMRHNVWLSLLQMTASGTGYHSYLLQRDDNLREKKACLAFIQRNVFRARLFLNNNPSYPLNP